MAESSGKDLELSFGELAVREKLISIAQVRECLELQKRMAAEGGTTLPLAQILIDRGYLTKDQVTRLLKLQATEAYGARLEIPGYEVLTKIGHGAMGSVFKARQLSMDRVVAVKLLSPDLSKDQAYVARFQREARACARLNHENIIGGFDIGTAGAFHYFVMEFVEGEPLSSILVRRQKLPEAECLRIATQVARALEHAHAQGIVHRDIKPENVMIAAGGVAKLCDLGLAKRVKIDPSITMEGMAVGTPHYIAPEQARGDANIDHRADLYSLGAMLYRMSTGVPPFQGHDAVVVMTKHVTDEPIPARERNPALSVNFNRLILRLMQKDPSRRPASAADLIKEIEGLNAPAPEPPKAVEAPKPVPKPVAIAPRPRPAPPKPSPWAPVAALGVIIVGLVAIWALWPRDNDPPVRRGGNSDASARNGGPTPTDDHQRLWDEFTTQRNASLSGPLPANIPNLESYLQKAVSRFSGTAHHEKWKRAHEEFRAEVNRKTADAWKSTDAEVKSLVNAGKFADAIAQIDAFPPHLLYFVPPPPSKPDAAVLTAAGAAVRDARTAISAAVGERLEGQRRAFTEALAQRRWADAITIAESFLAVNPSEGEEKRADAIKRHLADLPGESPTSKSLDAVEAAVKDYRSRYGSRAEIAPILDAALLDAMARRGDVIKQSRARLASYVRDTFYPACRAALLKRDLATARALYRRLFIEDPNDDFSEALREHPLNAEAMNAYTSGSFDGMPILLAESLEKAAEILRDGGSADLAWLYLLLFELTTIDNATLDFEGVLPMMIKDGYAFKASGLPVPPTKAEVERKDGRVSAHFTVPQGAGTAKMRRDLAPLSDSRLHVDDLVESIRRANVRPDQSASYLVAAGIVLFNADEPHWPKAKTLLSSGAAFAPGRAEAYGLWLNKLKDVATDSEEDEALRLYQTTKKDVRSAKPVTRARAQEACKKLLAAPLTNTRTVKDHRAEIEQWLKDLGGAAPTTSGPRKLDDLFAVKPVESKGTLEWTYDFSDAKHLEDFLGRAGDTRPQTVKLDENALYLEGMGGALWKGELTGAYEFEAEITPLDDTNIGLLTCATGPLPEGDGYLLIFRVNFMARMQPPNHIFFKLPIDLNSGRIPMPLGEEVGKYTIKAGTKFKVRWTRAEGNEMTISVDDKKIIGAADSKFTTGRPGFYVFTSRMRVDNVRIRGKLDEGWLKSELED